MSVRKDIMKLQCEISFDEADDVLCDSGTMDLCWHGFSNAQARCADIAEASEKKLLNRVKIWKMRAERVEDEQAALIAELRGVIINGNESDELLLRSDIEAILDKYEDKQ